MKHKIAMQWVVMAGFCLNILAMPCFAQQNYLDISVGSEGDGSWVCVGKVT